MITYEWIFTNFEVLPQIGELNTVVRSISWFYKGTSEDGKTCSIEGVSILDSPDANNFTSFNQLTKDWAIEVCSNNINKGGTVSEMQEYIALDISSQVTPTVVDVLPPPF